MIVFFSTEPSWCIGIVCVCVCVCVFGVCVVFYIHSHLYPVNAIWKKKLMFIVLIRNEHLKNEIHFRYQKFKFNFLVQST